MKKRYLPIALLLFCACAHNVFYANAQQTSLMNTEKFPRASRIAHRVARLDKSLALPILTQALTNSRSEAASLAALYALEDISQSAITTGEHELISGAVYSFVTNTGMDIFYRAYAYTVLIANLHNAESLAHLTNFCIEASAKNSDGNMQELFAAISTAQYLAPGDAARMLGQVIANEKTSARIKAKALQSLYELWRQSPFDAEAILLSAVQLSNISPQTELYNRASNILSELIAFPEITNE